MKKKHLNCVLLIACIFVINLTKISTYANEKTIFSVTELEELGASTIQESLILLKQLDSDSVNSTSTKTIQYNGQNYITDDISKLNTFLQSLPLNQIDQIELIKDNNEIKYHLSKSLTKNGIKALFSFSIIEEINSKNKLNPNVSTPIKTSIDSNQLGNNIKTISAEELEILGINTVDEALKLVSNLIFNNVGGLKTIFLRGFSNGNTKILYNGIDLKDAISIDGSPNFDFIPIEDINQIEIIAGSNSIFHGSGSTAGIINIITKSHSNSNYFNTKLSSQQYYNTIKSQFNISNTNIYLIGNQAHNNSLSTFTNTSESDLYSKQTLTIGFTQPNPTSKLTGLLTFIEGKQELDSEVYDQNWQVSYVDDPDYYTKSSQKLAKLSYFFNVNQHIKASIQWGANHINRHYNNVVDSSNSNTTDARYEGTTQTIEFNTHTQLSSNQHLSFGSELRHENGLSSGTWSGSTIAFPQQSQSSIGVYTHYLNTNKWLSTETGLRLENYSKSTTKSTISSYHLSLFRDLPFINTQLKTTIKSGFKLPTIYQRYEPSYGNSNLNVETSETKEITVTKVVKNIKMSTTLFESTLYDQISWAQNKYINQHKTQFTGTEYSIDCRDLNFMSFLKIDYTQFNSTFNKIPDYKAVVSIGTSLNKWKYGLSIYSIGKTTLPAYSYTDLNINYDFNDTQHVFTKIHNLLNTKYETVSGYNEAGFTLFVGMKQTF